MQSSSNPLPPATPSRTSVQLFATRCASRSPASRSRRWWRVGLARRFHGHVEVHDVEREDLVELGTAGSIPLRVHPALVRTDVVVVVTAAETVLHGGPAAFVGAAGTEVRRAAGAD